jgi:hypothetical protein
MAFVLYLVYAEIVLLHTLCEWCTVVHVLTFATFLLALQRWQQRGLPLPMLGSQPARSRESASTAATSSNGGAARKATTGSSNGARSGQRARR